MTDTSPNSELRTLLRRATAVVGEPTSGQRQTIERLEHLASRLSEAQLHVAVLGQFKRGKSSLLNAIIGVSALPVGITPVTAIPTFIRCAGKNRACVAFEERHQELALATGQPISDILADYISEERNPHNRLGVQRVDVWVSSQSLPHDVVLIDTPGVGSTFLHNTKAAEEILSACDAALFVVSADPPITAVEVDYLRQIQTLISKVIVVLNKVDLLTGEERETAEAFLRRMLTEQLGMDDSFKIFCVSAKRGLGARMPDDALGRAESGLAALESYLTEVISSEKQQIIAEIVRRRATTLVSELLLQTELGLKSLQMPLDDLKEKIATFEKSALEFRGELRSLYDIVALDRQSLLRDLEADTDRVWNEAKQALREQQALLLGETSRVDDVRSKITKAVARYFDDEFARFVPAFEQRLSERLSIHRQRADALVSLVRRTAAELMQISVTIPESSDALLIEREPYWVAPEPGVSLLSLSTGALSRMLPKSVRDRQARDRLNLQTEKAILRNVGNLEWAMRQNIEDTFRRFESSLGDQLARALEATLMVMQIAVQRHQDRAGAVEEAIRRSLGESRALREIVSELNA